MLHSYTPIIAMMKTTAALILFSLLSYCSHGQTEQLVLKSSFDLTINSAESKIMLNGNTTTVANGTFLSFTSFNGIGKLKNNKNLFYYGIILSFVNGISKDQNNSKTKAFQYGFGIQIGKQKFFEIAPTIYYIPSINFNLIFSMEKDVSYFYPNNDLIKQMFYCSINLMPFSIGFKIKKNLMTTLNMGQLGIYFNKLTEKRENSGNISKGVSNIFSVSANSNQFSIGLIFFLNSK